MEPLTGIEPVTFSFASTSVSPRGRLMRGLDCIFAPGAHPCQSFGRLWRHGLIRLGRTLTVIRDSREGYPSRGRGFAAHHGDALPTELQRHVFLFLPATYSGTEQVVIGVRREDSWLALAISTDFEEDLVFTINQGNSLMSFWG